MNNPLSHPKKSHMRTFVFFFAFVLSLPLFAQTERAGVTLSLSAGVLPTYLKDQAKQDVWPVSVTAGYRFKGMMELSAYAGYSVATSGLETLADETQVRYRNSSTIAGLKAALHTTRFERVDVYGGSMIGLYRSAVTRLNLDGTTAELPKTDEPTQTNPYKYNQPENKFLVTAFVGATWYVNDRISLHGEAGWGISILQAGVKVTL